MGARILVLLSLIWWGCEPAAQAVLEASFPDQRWVFPDTVWGEVVLQEPAPCRQVELRIDLAEAYPWRNLYLLLWVEHPDGHKASSRLELVFTDSLGNWYKPNRKFRTFVARQASFTQAGRYRLGLLPYIRQDTVVGVKRVGLYLYPCP